MNKNEIKNYFIKCKEENSGEIDRTPCIQKEVDVSYYEKYNQQRDQSRKHQQTITQTVKRKLTQEEVFNSHDIEIC